eukprot:1811201-Pleurochrysis_carterae.AAC.3
MARLWEVEEVEEEGDEEEDARCERSAAEQQTRGERGARHAQLPRREHRRRDELVHLRRVGSEPTLLRKRQAAYSRTRGSCKIQSQAQRQRHTMTEGHAHREAAG